MSPTKLLIFFCIFTLYTNSQYSQDMKDDSPSSLREMFFALPQRIRGYSNGSLETPPSLSIEERTRLTFLEEDRQILFNKIADLEKDIKTLNNIIESLVIQSKLLELMITQRDQAMVDIGKETTVMCNHLVGFIKKNSTKIKIIEDEIQELRTQRKEEEEEEEEEEKNKQI